MASIQDMIETAKKRKQEVDKRIKQLEARQDKAEAKKLHAVLKGQRAEDTRRKILIGAFVLEQMQRNGMEPGMMSYESKRLADWLTRDDDRALFNLQAK